MMKVLSPWIQVTNRCNLHCNYCFVNQNSLDMSEEVYNNINDTFFRLLDEGKVERVVYRVAGGEPLLVFDKCKNFMKEFLTRKNTFIEIDTNLLLLNDEIEDFFIAYKDRIHISVSVDGFKYSKPGVEKSEEVRAKIERLVKRGFSSISISTVIEQEAFEDLEKLAEWVAENGFHWGVNLDHYCRYTLSETQVIDKMYQVIDILYERSYNIVDNFLFNGVKLNGTNGCMAGHSIFAIDASGKIFPCHTLIGKEPVGDITQKDFLKELHIQCKYAIGNNYRLPEDCVECPLLKYCDGGCKLHSTEETRKYSCKIVKSVVLYTLETIMKEKE